MKCIALANRLARYLSEKSLSDLTADVRQEILDAINGGLQKLNAIAPHESKTVPVSIPVAEPLTIQIGVTKGSYDITGHVFTADQCYRTIRIDGDDIDNSIVGESSLFHPYGGSTGTVAATIYGDAIAIPEPYSELVGDPRIVETHTDLKNREVKNPGKKHVSRPSCYWMEANARNQNPPAPMVMRFDTLPDRAYRLEGKAILASSRVTFSDLLAAGVDVPIRDEHVESYLLPIAKAIMADSSLWRNKNTVPATVKAGELAEAKYAALVPRVFATPRNFVGTKRGW